MLSVLRDSIIVIQNSVSKENAAFAALWISWIVCLFVCVLSKNDRLVMFHLLSIPGKACDKYLGEAHDSRIMLGASEYKKQ